MSSARTCGRCGAPLGSDTLAGLCPECMLLSALEPDPDTPQPVVEEELPQTTPLPTSMVVSRFGDYELLEELAQGGMGVVYKARQVKLDRLVVVKMLLLGQRASDEVVERFKREAQMAARLHHPNIVAIHEVGEVEGQPFFSMDYVPGKDLAKIVRERPLPAREAATYMEAAAEATHYAHQQGIIHRDIKPSNILVDSATNEVRVTDFGLAKRLDDESDLTLSGQVMGSPNHMAPELAAGHHRHASPASDVFSLGTVLYELLTGRPPFLADSLQATLLKIRDADPVAPRELNARIPRDLETICLKCLEKEPGARFGSAQELAEELGRFLRGEPIRTRPAGVLEKTWRWCHRKPALAGLAGAIVALAVVSTVAAIRLAVAQRAQEREQYYAEIGLAKANIEEGNIDRALELLLHCPPRFRHWEWGHLLYLCHQETRTIGAHTNLFSTTAQGTEFRLASVTWMAFSPDSRSLVTLGADGTAKMWEVADGRLLYSFGSSSNMVSLLALSPEGGRLAVAQGKQVNLVNATNGESQLELPNAPGTITRLAWHPDAQLLAVGMEDGAVAIHNAANGNRDLVVPGSGSPITALFYTPDGSRLVRNDPLRCTAFDSSSGQELEGFAPDRKSVVAVVPDPEMRRFAVSDSESRISLWENGHAVQSLEKVFPPNDPEAPVVFSPDGRRFVTRTYLGVAKVWDAVTGQLLFVVPNRVHAAAFSKDGGRLVTSGDTTVAHVWDIDTGREVRALRGHHELVGFVAFSPDGRLVATAGRDGLVKLWSATDGREVIWHTSLIAWASTISPDGKLFTTGPVHDGVTVRESASGQGLLKLKVAGDSLLAARFSPDGTRLLTSSRFRQPRVWDVKTGRSLFTLEGHTRSVFFGIAFSPDGKRIVTSGFEGTARLWDAGTGRSLHVVGGSSGAVDGACFSPDSRLLATIQRAARGSEAVIWEVETGKLLKRFTPHEGGCVAVAFTPEGMQLATSGMDKTIRLWDLRSWGLKKEFRLRGFALLMRFTPDGKRLFCSTQKLGWGGMDVPALEVWDVEAGRQILTLTGHQDLHGELNISADGKQLLSSGFDGTVRQWQVFPWEESEYPGSEQTSFPSRVREYADRYWQARLAAEAAALTNTTPMRVVEIPFDRSVIPPRAPGISSRLIDLTQHYNSPLNRPIAPNFGDDVDNDLRNLPAGVRDYDGVAFDVRGVIQLHKFEPKSLFSQLNWGTLPMRADGIPIRQKVRRFHTLHGAQDPEVDGTVIGNLVWHYADGQERVSEIIYGRHVRDWWETLDRRTATPDARVAWQGTNPAAKDCAYYGPTEPGKELRLYVASWDNPRPDVEVTSVDLVSTDTRSAPFFLGITVE